MSQEKDALSKFGDMMIAARDAAIGDLIGDVDDNDSNITGAKSFLNSYNIDHDIIIFLCDYIFFKILYEFQDAKINYEIDISLSYDTKIYKLDEISDRIAGDFMTDEGWIQQRSQFKSVGI